MPFKPHDGRHMENDKESTNQLLRIIIALLLEQSEAFATLRAKIRFLDQSGMRPTEIAKVLGRTTTHVSKELAGLRKEKKR
jgi:hypothetical protein